MLCDRMVNVREFWKTGDYATAKCCKCGEEVMITPAGRKLFDPENMDPICPQCVGEVDEDIEFVLHGDIAAEMQADRYKFIHRN